MRRASISALRLNGVDLILDIASLHLVGREFDVVGHAPDAGEIADDPLGGGSLVLQDILLQFPIRHTATSLTCVIREGARVVDQ
jgi:hypothetical protein